MSKRTKRFIAGLLTAAMMTVSAVGVFASTDNVVMKYTGEKVISGNSALVNPYIEINVPTNGADLVINPYGVIKSTDEETDAQLQNVIKELKGSVSNASIISPELTVTNKSDIDVKMTIKDFRVTPSKSASGNYITIASSSVADKKNAVKSAYIYLQVSTDEKWLGQHVKEANGFDAKGKRLYDNNTDYKNALKKEVWELKAKAGVDKKGVTLAKDKGSTLKDISVAKEKTVYLKLMGDVNSEPIVKGTKGVKDLWNQSDSLSVSYKLVFDGIAETQGK
jgi:hypothetical protein